MNVQQSDIDGINAAHEKRFLTEKADNSKHNTKPGKGDKDLPVEGRKHAEDKKEESQLGNEDSSGPAAADNFKVPTEVGTEATIQPENVVGEVKKEAVKDINISMSKSKFDTLYEDVMDDEAALGIEDGDAGGDDEGGFDEFDGGEDEGGDVVSLELPKDLADALYEALATVCGGDDEEVDGELSDDEGAGVEDSFGADLGGGFDEMEERKVAREAVESSAAPDGVAKLTGKDNKAAHQELVDNGGADSSVTDKVGNDGEMGTPVKGMKKGQDLTTRKKYKVEAKLKNNPGDQAFSGK